MHISPGQRHTTLSVLFSFVDMLVLNHISVTLAQTVLFRPFFGNLWSTDMHAVDILHHIFYHFSGFMTIKASCQKSNDTVRSATWHAIIRVSSITRSLTDG